MSYPLIPWPTSWTFTPGEFDNDAEILIAKRHRQGCESALLYACVELADNRLYYKIGLESQKDKEFRVTNNFSKALAMLNTL